MKKCVMCTSVLGDKSGCMCFSVTEKITSANFRHLAKSISVKFSPGGGADLKAHCERESTSFMFVRIASERLW